MVNRISTSAFYNLNLSNLGKIQKNVYLHSFQGTTGLIGENYACLGSNTYNLLTFENQQSTTNQFITNNTTTKTYVDSSYKALESVQTAITDFQSALNTFYQLDLSNLTPDYAYLDTTDANATVESCASNTGDLTFNMAAGTISAGESIFKDTKAGSTISLDIDTAQANKFRHYVTNSSGEVLMRDTAVPPNEIYVDAEDMTSQTGYSPVWESEIDDSLAKTYYVTSVSADGKTITVSELTPVTSSLTVHSTPENLATPSILNAYPDANTPEYTASSSNVTSETFSGVNVNFLTTKNVDSETISKITSIQQEAFNTLKSVIDVLNNTKIGNHYLFGGGNDNNQPVNFPFDTLEEFQAYYNGTTTTVPQTAAANMADFEVFFKNTGGELTLSRDLNANDIGYITSVDPIVLDTLNASSTITGNIGLDASKNTITCQNKGSFSHIGAGDTIILDYETVTDNGIDPPVTTEGANNGVYYVDYVSEDGRTIYLKSDAQLTTSETVSAGVSGDDTTSLSISRSVPIGTNINLNGVDGIASEYTVLGIENDGKTLKVKTEWNAWNSFYPAVTFDETSAGIDYNNLSISASSYYEGSNLETTHRIDSNQTVSVGYNGDNPVFEKIFRALSTLCQDNIIDETNPYDPNNFYTNALTGDFVAGQTYPLSIDGTRTQTRVDFCADLLQDAISHSNTNNTENKTDLTKLLYSTSLTQVKVDRKQTELKALVDNLTDYISSIENTDKTAAITALQQDYTNLEIAYNVTSTIMQLSLANYLK